LEKQTHDRLQQKQMELRNIALKCFKNLINFKLDNVSEKPLQILKRLDNYESKPRIVTEQQECDAVMVKVLVHDLEVP
jgi:hypothetical protein